MRKILWKSAGKRLIVKQEKAILETLEQLKNEGKQGKIELDASYGFNMALRALELEIIDEG